jgi:hypothetical protein
MTIRVHQIWLQGRAAIPSDILLSMQTWIEATSTRRNYGYVLWDDQAIRELLAGATVPRIREIYERLPDHLYGIRADIARLVILLRFGGLYADADTRILRAQPLLDYLEAALLDDGTDIIVGTADLNGCTRRWIEAMRRPSNFLLACREGSSFVGVYLRSIVDDFEALRLGDRLARDSQWSRYECHLLTKKWTGPGKLRALLKAPTERASERRLTPVGFVASGHQSCFPDAVVAHDYKGNWYAKSKPWAICRNGVVYTVLRTPLDAWIVLLLSALCLASVGVLSF